jgi:hypothetical protein
LHFVIFIVRRMVAVKSVIIPMQDVLGLGGEARMNIPCPGIRRLQEAGLAEGRFPQGGLRGGMKDGREALLKHG